MQNHFSSFFVFSFLCSIISSTANASALVKVEGGVIHVISRMVYSGPALTPEIAEASTREIRRMWNVENHFVNFEGKLHRVVFDIDYQIENSTPVPNEYSCAYNYINVQAPQNPGDRSLYYYLGANGGIFYTSDHLGTSTTAAHEYGHGLGLEHNDVFQENAEVPGIMFARGTFVQPHFRYNPEAASGTIGGTLNPIFRQVRKSDVQDIDLSQVRWAFALPFMARYGCLGTGLIERIPGR